MRSRYVPRVDFLMVLQEDAARPDFYAPPGYFQELHEAFDGQMTGGAEEILELLHRLRKPEKFAPTPGPAPADATSDEDWQEQLENWEAEDFPTPKSKIPVAEGAEREPLREELRELVARELAAVEAAWNPALAESEKPLTMIERDNLAADVNPQTELMRRQEDSCFRQFWRLGSFLMKIQDRAEERQDSGSRSSTVPS